MDNLEQVKKALEIEVKHKYININGKSRSFSSFICSVLRKEIKLYPENPKWKVLLEHFERYPMETVISRKRSLERFVSVIKAQYLEPQEKEPETKMEKRPISQTDVMYIKGVGPKIAYLMNKLGIYTASDLLYYFPRKNARPCRKYLQSKKKSCIIASRKGCRYVRLYVCYHRGCRVFEPFRFEECDGGHLFIVVLSDDDCDLRVLCHHPVEFFE